MHYRQTPCRVQHKLQVDERCPYRQVSQPPTQAVDGDAVHQQVAFLAVAQCVRPEALSSCNRPQPLCSSNCSLYPAPGSGGVCLYDFALADVSVS